MARSRQRRKAWSLLSPSKDPHFYNTAGSPARQLAIFDMRGMKRVLRVAGHQRRSCRQFSSGFHRRILTGCLSFRYKNMSSLMKLDGNACRYSTG